MTSRSKQACRPARTPVRGPLTIGALLLASEPHVMPQYAVVPAVVPVVVEPAAEVATAVRGSAPAAIVTARAWMTRVVRSFMAALLSGQPNDARACDRVDVGISDISGEPPAPRSRLQRVSTTP